MEEYLLRLIIRSEGRGLPWWSRVDSMPPVQGA